MKDKFLIGVKCKIRAEQRRGYSYSESELNSHHDILWILVSPSPSQLDCLCIK